MRIGVVFPQTELGGDASAVRAYGQHVEELGFTHLLAYDHVAGADPAVHDGSAGPYDLHITFHEPLVMFGYLAAVTSTLELVTGVIILPQRQMVLVAKQGRPGRGDAAVVDRAVRDVRRQASSGDRRRPGTAARAAIGMEGRVTWLGDPRQVADELAQWTAAGATHVSVNTMGAGLRTVDEHLAALAAVAENLPVYHPQ